MKVLLVKPDEYAQEADIENGLRALQKIVGGRIETLTQRADPVVYVFNEEGKTMGLDPNRVLYDRQGKPIDFIAGTFIVCGHKDGEFVSLSPGQMEKYKDKFFEPEVIFAQDGNIIVLKDNPEPKQSANLLQDSAEQAARNDTARPAPETSEIYKYYSTQRPIDIGTFPKTESGPRDIVNFDKREYVEHGRFAAWGYLEYSAPLTKKQTDDYELRPAIGNPDRRRMEEQAQTVGKWEQAHRVPDTRRLTWWYPDFGVFVAKEFVAPEQLAERHGQIIEKQTLAAEKRAASKPIAERMKEGAEQAAKDNAARPLLSKDKDKGDR